jgi:hypothetical protein
MRKISFSKAIKLNKGKIIFFFVSENPVLKRYASPDPCTPSRTEPLTAGPVTPHAIHTERAKSVGGDISPAASPLATRCAPSFSARRGGPAQLEDGVKGATGAGSLVHMATRRRCTTTMSRLQPCRDERRCARGSWRRGRRSTLEEGRERGVEELRPRRRTWPAMEDDGGGSPKSGLTLAWTAA